MKNHIVPILYALFPLSGLAQTAVNADIKIAAEDEINKEIATPLGTFSRMNNVNPSEEVFAYSSGTFTTADGGTAEFLIAAEENSSPLTEKFNGRGILSPNPFHNSTNVFIDAKKDFHAGSLIVYDLFGREISKTFLSDTQTEFFRGSLSNGMYFYKITGEDEMLVDMGKFVVN